MYILLTDDELSLLSTTDRLDSLGGYQVQLYKPDSKRVERVVTAPLEYEFYFALREACEAGLCFDRVVLDDEIMPLEVVRAKLLSVGMDEACLQTMIAARLQVVPSS